MAPPPPAAVSWSDGLHVDLLVLLFLNLHCIADRASFAAVCRSWQKAKRVAEAADSRSPPRPCQIPWLLSASSAQGQGPSIISFLSGCRRRIRSLPDDIAPGRLCGSHPGGWVAAVLGRWGGQLLFNVFSGKRIPLPLWMRLEGGGFSTGTPAIILSVVLSASPNTDHCLAGAIVCGTSNIAFCRPGVDLHWKACQPEYYRLQDMVYYEGDETRGFHVLTEEGHVVVLKIGTVEGRGGGTTITGRVRYNAMPSLRPDTLLSSLPSSTSVTRYLVVSRQRLLMVARYFREEGSSGTCRTLLFRVFEMQVVASPQGHHNMACWLELEEGLDGRVIFVGRGCSRAYEASQLHGFKEGSIYFVDDAKFDLALQPVYSCTDVGMYSMSTRVVVRPSLDAPTTANMSSSSVYSAKTHLCWVDTEKKATNEAKKSLMEMGEDERQPSGSKIMGIRWNFPSQPMSKFSPPIWFAP